MNSEKQWEFDEQMLGFGIANFLQDLNTALEVQPKGHAGKFPAASRPVEYLAFQQGLQPGATHTRYKGSSAREAQEFLNREGIELSWDEARKIMASVPRLPTQAFGSPNGMLQRRLAVITLEHKYCG